MFLEDSVFIDTGFRGANSLIQINGRRVLPHNLICGVFLCVEKHL